MANTQQQSGRKEQEYSHREAPKNVEAMTTSELQQTLTDILSISLLDRQKSRQTHKMLTLIQDESLHLEHPITAVKRPINANLLPTVISKENEKCMSDFVAVTNIVRAAVLLRCQEDDKLRKFLNSGVDPLTVEIMEKNPFELQRYQWRWRADTSTNQLDGNTKSIECNGGEPQGDIIVTDAMIVAENAMSIALGEEVPHFHERPDQKMMEVLVSRYHEITGKTDTPTIGYFAWKGRSSLSHAEARYSSKRYRNFYNGDAIAFDPTDIVDIRENLNEGGQPYYTIVCRDTEKKIHEVEIVRRLHGEPMENMDLWSNFKETYGQTMCSDGKETIWERFTGKLSGQMINPLNSRATDKKLDVVLGNALYLERFRIWEKVKEILDSQELSEKASISEDLRRKGVGYFRDKLKEYVPTGVMLRRMEDGLFTGDTETNDLCLSEDHIQSIKGNRQRWVLKRYSLEGHSGTAVHVGRGLNPAELEYEDFMLFDDTTLKKMTGMSREVFEEAWKNGVIRVDSIIGRYDELSDRTKSPQENAQLILRLEITRRFEQEMTEEERNVVMDTSWEVLIENSLKRPDCLIQEAIPQQEVQVILFPPDSDTAIQTSMHWDLDPQSVGIGTYTFPVVRVTKASKTNITGGYGALGTGITEEKAREIVKIAQKKGII